MIYGIGTDIIEIERIQKACQRQAFLEKQGYMRARQLLLKKVSTDEGVYRRADAAN